MTASSALPETVERAVGSWLHHHDQLAPGVVEGLYLVGSAAFDDWQPGSDIDIVAFTPEGMDRADVTALQAAHDATCKEHGAVDIDGPRLTWIDVAERPRPMVRPWTLGGEFHCDDSCFELNPVVWQTLAVAGIAVRGPAPNDIEIATSAGLWIAESLSQHRRLVDHALIVRRSGSTTPDDRATAAATARYMQEVIDLIAG